MRFPLKVHSFQKIKEMGIPVGAVIDVGVLTGTFDLMREFAHLRQLLVEPIEEWNGQIRRAYDRANVDYELVNVAAAEQDGTMFMKSAAVRPDQAITHARLTDETEGENLRKVEVRTIDTLLAERDLPEPYLLKLDVDGAEMRILEGARATLPRCSVIVIEANIKNYRERIDVIESKGFELFDIVDFCYYEGRLRQFDLVFLNRATVRALDLDMYNKPFDIAKWEPFLPDETTVPGRRGDGTDPFLEGRGFVAYDAHWQFPAVTEQHAFDRIRAIGGLPAGFTYAAFPWATLIDKTDRNAPDLQALQAAFDTFCARLPRDTTRITVCQHIHFPRFEHLFRKAGIHHVFWSHCRQDQRELPGGDTPLALHPFPLYPVQKPGRGGQQAPERQFLFSFIGARANRWYMTEARNWILDRLSDHPRGLVLGRDQWHFQKVVYDHQVAGKAGGDEALTDAMAADQFIQTLLQSTFSLCPSGSGPNSIRLWESLGAGAIPVILSDRLALPGPLELWHQAAVFCEETPEAIAALPARLEEIEAAPERLEAMRHAGRQLGLLYGPDTFVSDIVSLVLVEARRMRPALPGQEPLNIDDKVLQAIAERHPDAAAASPAADESRLILKATAGHLLVNSGGVESLLGRGRKLHLLVAAARRTLGPENATVVFFDRVLAHKGVDIPRAPAPMVGRGAKPAVILYGRHSARTPLGYDAYRGLAEDRLEWADRPEKADVLVAGFVQDLLENTRNLFLLQRSNPALRIAVISEEPLWDTIWSKGFTDRDRTVGADEAAVPFTFLNHQTSRIFDFDRLPYFLTTDDRYVGRYWQLFRDNAEVSGAAWPARWDAAPIRHAFFAEKRSRAIYDQAWDALDVCGLSAYRTRLAEALAGPGSLTVGAGWSDGNVPRQALVDWHLDKLATLRGRAAVVSGLENTHHRQYVSEKVFDAFAVGGIPVYYASPEHRVFDFVQPEGLVNCFGRTAEDSAALLRDFSPGREFLNAYAASQKQLAQRFSDPAALVAERWRVLEEILAEIGALCGEAAPDRQTAQPASA